MRYVDFEKVKDILLLVYQNEGKLSATQLEDFGIKKGILLGKNGKQMTHSTRYHYRKVMEHLGLIYIDNHKYYISKSDKVRNLLQDTDNKEALSHKAKELFGDMIVENEDCQRYFFDIFMDNDNYMREDLEKRGRLAEIIKNGSNCSALFCIVGNTGKKILIRNQDEIQSILWGVKIWAKDLHLVDELLFMNEGGRDLIYPIARFDKRVAIKELINYIQSDPYDQDVMFLYIPDFVKKLAVKNRFSKSDSTYFLETLQTSFQSFISFVPTSSRFVRFRSSNPAREKNISAEYIINGGQMVSHLKIDKKVKEELGNAE
jgi:hypothetical protein